MNRRNAGSDAPTSGPAGSTVAEPAPAVAPAPASPVEPSDVHAVDIDGSAPDLGAARRVVLYGIGNDLRGDDGAGVRVASALEGRVPWRVRIVHGLTPELADELAEVDVALFVDADADPCLQRPTWRRHGSAGGRATAPLTGHALDVPSLLTLTAWLHERAPVAATLSLPARSFDLGETLSAPAAAGVATAIRALTRLARG